MISGGEQFVVSFTRLRELVDDDPDMLKRRWQEDAEIQHLCVRIALLLIMFEGIERESLLTAPVNQSAIQLRKECDRDWKDLIFRISAETSSPLRVFLKFFLKTNVLKRSKQILSAVV